MSFIVCTELDSGARSRGYVRETEEAAMKTAKSVLRQLSGMVNAAVLVISDGVEVFRERPNA